MHEDVCNSLHSACSSAYYGGKKVSDVWSGGADMCAGMGLLVSTDTAVSYARSGDHMGYGGGILRIAASSHVPSALLTLAATALLLLALVVVA